VRHLDTRETRVPHPLSSLHAVLEVHFLGSFDICNAVPQGAGREGLGQAVAKLAGKDLSVNRERCPTSALTLAVPQKPCFLPVW
jgi:hypothetical protein